MLRKSLMLIGCGILNLTLAYYFLFLEKDYPVSRLGAKRQQFDAVRELAVEESFHEKR